MSSKLRTLRVRRVRWFVAALVVTTCIAVAALWRLITLYGLMRLTEMEFRNQTDLMVLKADDDWAWQFGGRLGLPILKDMSTDPNLSPAQRAVAQRIYGYVHDRKHVILLRDMKTYYELHPEVDGRNWFQRQMMDCVLMRDAATASAATEEGDRVDE